MGDRRGGGYGGGGGGYGGGGGGYGGGGGGYGGGGRDGGRGGRGGRGGGRGRGRPMQRDEAKLQDSETQQHLKPIISQITQLSIGGEGGVQMPHSMDPSEVQVAQRPKDPATQGKAVKLATNFYRCNFDNVPPIMHHDCRVERLRYNPETQETTPEKDPGDGSVKPVSAGIIAECVKRWTKQMRVSKWAYDGRNNLFAPETLVEANKLAADKYQEFPLEWREEGRKHPARYLLRVKMVGRVTMDDLISYLSGTLSEWPAMQLQALEIVLNSPFICNPSLLYISRTLFPADQRAEAVGQGGEAWIGYKQDLRPCQDGLMLSIEPSFSVFYQGKPLVDYCQAVLSRGRNEWQWTADKLNDGEMRECSKNIKGLTVVGNYLKSGKTTKVIATGLSREGASRYPFEFTDRATGETKEITVAEYFAKHVGVRLQFPHLQCVTAKGRKKPGQRKADPIAIPLELLSIEKGQKRRGLLIGDQQANLVRKAAQPPEQKRSDIDQWMAKAADSMQQAKQAFGIEVSPKPAMVNGRLLPAPVLQYGQPQNYYAGTTGAWNMIDFRMLEPVKINNWAIIVCMNDRDLRGNGMGSLDNFIGAVGQGFGAMGMQISPQPVVQWASDMGRYPDAHLFSDSVTQMQKAASNISKAIDVVFVIIPKKDPSMYKVIKRELDSARGLVSQVIVASKASGLGPQAFGGGRGPGTSPTSQLQYVANVGLKVNHKLGGRNMQIRSLGADSMADTAPPIWSGKPTMLLGVDVSHPQSFDPAEPSIVGLVASMDKSFAQYSSRIKLIGHREEVVSGMKTEIMELLKLFREHNKGVKPESIVVYRDGVSHGEFKEVLAKEYTAIREAGLELEAGYTPPITYVTVLKRHRARLFPTDESANDGSGNVRPGICVDSGIALASGFDFYLNAHKGIQGTVKPAHYHVLHDENAFGADAIQIATYWLCYAFCRCTRSVSYCPPAYYAHLVAERGRVLLDREGLSEDYGPRGTAPSTTSGGDGSSGRPAVTFHGVHENIRDKMFFC